MRKNAIRCIYSLFVVAPIGCGFPPLFYGVVIFGNKLAEEEISGFFTLIGLLLSVSCFSCLGCGGLQSLTMTFPSPKVIKRFSCSTQLSMKFHLSFSI